MVRTARHPIDDTGGPGLVRAACGGIWRVARRRPTDTTAIVLAFATTAAIAINALFLQSGPHPAPIFVNKPLPMPAAAAVLPRQRPAHPPADTPRPRSDAVVAEIQRELARRGFYNGVADGVYGPQTDTAIRDFEHAAGLRPSAEPNDVLLQTIARSQVKAKPATPPRDPIAALLVPDRRVIAVQRALADFGFGQIDPSGVVDPATRAAIERFERQRKLPVTGQISERLIRELSLVTGRPLE